MHTHVTEGDILDVHPIRNIPSLVAQSLMPKKQDAHKIPAVEYVMRNNPIVMSNY